MKRPTDDLRNPVLLKIHILTDGARSRVNMRLPTRPSSLDYRTVHGLTLSECEILSVFRNQVIGIRLYYQSYKVTNIGSSFSRL